MTDIPQEAAAAAVDAVMQLRGLKSEGSREWAEPIVTAALEAAAPVLERHIRRALAREILHLDAADRSLSRNVGPYGDMRTSLRRLARGEQLPAASDLRGGEAVREEKGDG